MTLHKIKILPEFRNPILSGEKLFEIRKDDRDYKQGDLIQFILVDGIPETLTPCPEVFSIKYILRHKDFPEGIPKGYCVFSIERVR